MLHRVRDLVRDQVLALVRRRIVHAGAEVENPELSVEIENKVREALGIRLLPGAEVVDIKSAKVKAAKE